jgi:N-methylhydantoinase A/acetophenone carboxylase
MEPQNGVYFEDYDTFNKVVKGLRQQAVRDISGEGFDLKNMRVRLELEMKFGGQVHMLRVNSPHLALNSQSEVQAICGAFFDEFVDVYGSVAVYPEGGIEIQNFIMHCSIPQHKIELPTYPLAGEKISKNAYKEERLAYWEEYSDYRLTPIFNQNELKPQNIIEGPAIIEGRDTSVVLDPGAKLTVDKYLNFLITMDN